MTPTRPLPHPPIPAADALGRLRQEARTCLAWDIKYCSLPTADLVAALAAIDRLGFPHPDADDTYRGASSVHFAPRLAEGGAS